MTLERAVICIYLTTSEGQYLFTFFGHFYFFCELPVHILCLCFNGLSTFIPIDLKRKSRLHIKDNTLALL